MSSGKKFVAVKKKQHTSLLNRNRTPIFMRNKRSPGTVHASASKGLGTPQSSVNSRLMRQHPIFVLVDVSFASSENSPLSKTASIGDLVTVIGEMKTFGATAVGGGGDGGPQEESIRLSDTETSPSNELRSLGESLHHFGYLQARIVFNSNGLDVRLFQEALTMRRKFFDDVGGGGNDDESTTHDGSALKHTSERTPFKADSHYGSIQRNLTTDMT